MVNIIIMLIIPNIFSHKILGEDEGTFADKETHPRKGKIFLSFVPDDVKF